MTFGSERLPIDEIGGEAAALALAEKFYDVMEATEPGLVAVHRQEPPGKIHPESRERFGLFLVGWLGGAQTYSERFGHPRLRMRHAAVAINVDARDAWLRCMSEAMNQQAIGGEARAFLDARFRDVADFLRNVQ